jgi:hypothetical protein
MLALKIIWLALGCLCLDVISAPVALGQCEGLTHVGKMERSTNGLEVKERTSINVPTNRDLSYHQPSPLGKGGQAGSILSQQTIPVGICIVADGRGSYGWAVSDPTMLNDHTFQMYLYCSQDQGVLNLEFGCAVSVDVYVKVADLPVPPTPRPPVPSPTASRPPKDFRDMTEADWEQWRGHQHYVDLGRAVRFRLENLSAFDNLYYIWDAECKEPVSAVDIKAHALAFLVACPSSAGYGEVYMRKADSNEWTRFSLIENGDILR